MTGEESRHILIAHRMEQAEESLSDATLLLEGKRYRASVNRSYYAMFYAVLALLIAKGLGTSKHSGAIALFDREYVRNGIFARDLSKWLHTTFLERQKADYDDLSQVDGEQAETAVRHANTFVAQVRSHLQESAAFVPHSQP
ncbi:MAG: HEPN domain-containing protein [Magnetococcales bacterium]|nr:HEPN domain-containing protein [Magnetococcales bacterium]